MQTFTTAELEDVVLRLGAVTAHIHAGDERTSDFGHDHEGRYLRDAVVHIAEAISAINSAILINDQTCHHCGSHMDHPAIGGEDQHAYCSTSCWEQDNADTYRPEAV